LISSETTDTGGNAQFQLQVGSTYYRFLLYVSGTLRLTSSTFKITDTDLKYIITETFVSPLLDLLRAQDITGDIAYANSTQTLTFTWVDQNSYASLIAFNVTSGNQTYYSNTSTDGNGTMTFTITEANQTYSAIGTAKISGRPYTLDTYSVNLRDFWRQFGLAQSIIISMITILLLGLIGVKSPQLCIILTGVGITLVFFMGMLPVGAKALISIMAVGLILITLMKERHYQ